MKIEVFTNTSLSYIRRVGAYGEGNVELMTHFKDILKYERLYNYEMVLLGIALDDPLTTDASIQRYDIGIVNVNYPIKGLETRLLPAGSYAIFEVVHTQVEVEKFWHNLGEVTKNLVVDDSKPILERYTLTKIEKHRCEFCIPILT